MKISLIDPTMTKIKLKKKMDKMNKAMSMATPNCLTLTLDAMELVWVRLRVWGWVCCHGDQV